MRLPRLAPSIDRRAPATAPAGPVVGDSVRPQICPVKLCKNDNDCSGNGACTTCNTAMGMCVTSA
jgi:hypothetical protein